MMTVFSEVTAAVSLDVIKTVPLFAKLISDLGGEYGLEWYYETSNGEPSDNSTVSDDIQACFLHGTWNNIKEFHDVLDNKYRQSQALRNIQDLAFSKHALKDNREETPADQNVIFANCVTKEKNKNHDRPVEWVPGREDVSMDPPGVPGWIPRFRRAKKNKSYAEPTMEGYDEEAAASQEKQKTGKSPSIYNEDGIDNALDDGDVTREDEEEGFIIPAAATQRQTKTSQKCQFCDDFETKVVSDWCNHTIENHLTKKWLCPLCDRSTIDKGELRKHLQRHCMQQQPFKCNKCRKIYVSQHSLKIHKCKPKVKRYPCKVCGKAYVKKEYLRWHSCGQRTRKCWKYYTCGYCQVKFADQIAYEEHEAECEADSKGIPHATKKHPNNESGEIVDANIADKAESNDSNDAVVIVPKSASDWKAHYKIVDGIMVCIHCDFKSEYRRHLRTHLMRKHFAKSLQCPECDCKFAIPRDLKFHMESRHFNVKYICEVCGKQYRSKTALVIHERRHKEGPKQIPCDMCGKKFSSLQYVNVHKEKVHGGKVEEYFCEQCGKKFANKYYLRDHQKTHGDQMPYECAECFKAFAHKRSYECHLQSHKAERNKVCHVCGKGFKATSHLNMHLRIHYGQKPFVCSYCGRGFTQKKTMMEHARTHTGEKPVQCKVCNKTFAHGSTLHKHMRVHTKQVIDGGLKNIEQASKQLAETSLQQVQESISQLADTALKQHQLQQHQIQHQPQHQTHPQGHLSPGSHEQDPSPVQTPAPTTHTTAALYSNHPIYHYSTLPGLHDQHQAVVAPPPTPLGEKQHRSHPTELPHIAHAPSLHSAHMIPAHNMYGPGPLGSAYALDAQSFQEVHQLMHPPQQ